MKELFHAPEDLPYHLVNYGVDTLSFNICIADARGKRSATTLSEDTIVCLNAWKNLAQEKEQPIPLSDFTFEDAAVMIAPHGAGRGQWSWLLTCPAFKLCVGRGRLNGVVGQLRFNARYLWSFENPDHAQDIWAPIQRVKAFLLRFYSPESGRLFLQPSELHLCADVVGWDVSSCTWQKAFLTRATTRADRAEPQDIAGGAPLAVYNGRRLSTLTFGTHASALSCCIYHKTLEIKVSLKQWFEEIWKRHGWDGTSDVWRVEFRWKREALHSMQEEGVFHGVEDVYDLEAPLLASLWAYAAGHTQCGDDGYHDGWLRCTLPSEDSNVSRWPTHSAWSVVQTAFSLSTEPAVNVQTGEVFDVPASSLVTLLRKRHYEENQKRLTQQVGGCLSTLSAWLRGNADDLPSILTYLQERLPAYALPKLAKVAPLEKLQEAFARQFAKKVAEKRALYDLPEMGIEQK